MVEPTLCVVFAKSAMDRGETRCELCAQPIFKADDFAVELPLPTTSAKQVKLVHLACLRNIEHEKLQV